MLPFVNKPETCCTRLHLTEYFLIRTGSRDKLVSVLTLMLLISIYEIYIQLSSKKTQFTIYLAMFIYKCIY